MEPIATGSAGSLEAATRRHERKVQQNFTPSYAAWPLMQQVTGANVYYSGNVTPATYTQASSILNR